MAKYTERQLMIRLPSLPQPKKNSISSSVIAGFTTGTGQNRFVLIDLNFRGLHDQKFVPDPKVDLMTKNASRRKMFTLDDSRRQFMGSLNLALRGGESFPILAGLLGIATGAVSAGAGILFSVTTMAVSASQTSQPIQARHGDEIWQVELVGKDGQKMKHAEYFVIVDPFRAKSVNAPSEWVIHEERRDVVLS